MCFFYSKIRAQSPSAIVDARRDTVQLEFRHHAPVEKYDSVFHAVSSDTLKIVNKFILKFDSLRGVARLQPDSLKILNSDRIKEAFDKKVDSLKFTAQEEFFSTKLKINEKLSFPEQSGIDSITTDLPVTGQFPKVRLNSPDLNPDVNIPKDGLTIPDAQIPELNIPQTTPLELPKLDKVKVPENVTEVTDVINANKDVLDEAANMNTETIENLPEDLESKAAQLDEVQELQKQRDQMERYKDPMVMKEQALNKAKETAVNHFKGHEEELKAAMEEFAKVRAKIPDPDGVYDMMKKRSNPYKGKSFAERIQPGIALQVQKPNSIWLDINPYLLYKLSGRFYTGLGWNERLIYNTSDKNFEQRYRIYGARMNFQFKIKSNIWLKADAEDMNVWSPSGLADSGNRQWVWSFFGGMRNDFQLSKRLHGNIQVLYNLYNPDNRSPYANRLNVRFGLELIRKKQ